MLKIARRKLDTFLRMPLADRLLLFEAIVLLGLARLAIVSLPFRLIARSLQRLGPVSGYNEKLLPRVRRAVIVAARHVPWNAVCLPQAIAAMVMLARRGCGSTVHLGAGKTAEGALTGHAWLVCGDTIVVGAEATSTVTPLAQFGG